MSLNVSVFVNEGIVMASDSKTTFTREIEDRVMVGIHTNNTTRKTFLCPNHTGISYCGDGSVMGVPIAGYIEDFIREFIFEDTQVVDMPELLLTYFRKLSSDNIKALKINFTIGGYWQDGISKRQKLYKIQLSSERIEEVDTKNQGATWSGEAVVLSKLVNPMYAKTTDGRMIAMPHAEILWNFFTLQDAINFAKFAIKTTIDTMHFQNVIETVGEPIDILLLKPEGAQWITHQQLHG